ncbi:MAG: peptidoglycan-binding protein [Clostridia bacterium]|nr:peptidoglycan-binding protein [Clostridia bacterium]MBQ8850811.1 peptidoglycan-binding protein [Clostridia bacterium]
MDANIPYIPETITVHLGAPNADAENVTLPFAEYIANVASSEIYPTWPESAIRANIYAQISFALNRIYTEYYRIRGYDFDITNSTAYDQYFVKDRDYFENISEIVGDLFNNYIVRRGNVEPLFAQYCDGVEVSCNGLSQWGSVELANQGYTPYEILQYYYGEDIDLVRDAPVMGISSSLPDRLLRIGTAGDDVRQIQIRLNRISDNYPSIPKIAEPDGVFSFDTEEAVKQFQEIFSLTPDGVVGKSTWFAIQFIYNAVKRLNELNSEGIKLSEVTQQYPGATVQGDSGVGVQNIQYLIAYLSKFYSTIPSVAIDGIYGASTADAVRAVQRTFDLPVTGEVDFDTWDVMYRTYLGFIETIPYEYIEGNILPYPGIPLRIGSEDDSVRVLQEYLSFISGFIPEVPSVNVTGYFGTQTRAAVIAFQQLYGIPANGTVGSVTWNAISDLYSDLYNGSRLGEGQYPGYEIGR